MASGFVTPAGDLDTLLAPLGSYTARANVGFLIAGQDAAQRYAPVSAGSAYGTTDFICPAGDLGNLFAAFGSTGYSGTLTAASLPGPAVGYESGVGGSISPTTFRGNAINELLTNSSGTTFFGITIATNPGAGYFVSLTVNGHTLTTASATYAYSAGVATWQWSTAALAAPGSYSVTIS